MPAMHPIQRREWLFPLLLAAFFVVAGTAPYVYGYQSAGSDEVFMGFVGRGTPGANSYLAFARQVEAGSDRTTNLYNPHAPSRAYFNPEWWCMGAAARLSGLPLLFWFHTGRVLSAVAFLLAAYYLCAAFLNGIAARRAALALIAFGAGFGWLLAGINALAGTDLGLTNDARGVTIFGYLMNKPHFIRAGAFAALQYAWLIRGDQTGKTRYFLLSGLAASGHSLIRPYHIPEACLTLALYFAARTWGNRTAARTTFGHVFASALGHVPAIVWQAFVYLKNPLGLGAMDAWPPFLLLALIGWFGLPLAAILIQFGVRVLRGGAAGPHLSVPVLWLAAAALLLHAHPWFPWGVESYFPWIFAPPLLFLRHTWPRIAGWCDTANRRRIAIALLALACLPTNLMVYTQFFTTLHRPQEPWRYYLDRDTLDAIGWLRDNAPEEATVIASHATSQFIPRLANLRVLTGQDALTPNYRAMNSHVLRFFQSPGDDAFKKWLCREQGAAYVLAGPEERALGIVGLETYRWLAPVHSAGATTVYRVSP